MTYLIIGGTLLTASLLAFAAVFQYKRVCRAIDDMLVAEAAEPVAVGTEPEPEPEPIAKAPVKRKRKKKRKVKVKKKQDEGVANGGIS